MIKPGTLQSILKLPPHLRIPILLRQSRCYHSYEHEEPSPFTPAEHSILSAALAQVPTHGFTQKALSQGARDAGYLDISANLFPSGPLSIVNYHLVTQRLALAQHAPPITQRSTSPSNDISANIKHLSLFRLQANKSIIHQWPEALALLSTPRHLSTSIRELALLSDEILFLAGSTTVTSAWYANRAALGAIYASAELFMTQDQSSDFEETEAFLATRLKEGERARGLLSGVGAWAGMQAGGLLDGLRSKGVWI